MEPLPRDDIRRVLTGSGSAPRNASTTTDTTEEVILLDQADYERVRVDELTTALMAVPHTKVWVIPEGDRWTTEPI